MSDSTTETASLPPYLQGLRDARTAIINAAPAINSELRYDGSEDPEAAQYVEGWRDAWAAINTMFIEADERYLRDAEGMNLRDQYNATLASLEKRSPSERRQISRIAVALERNSRDGEG